MKKLELYYSEMQKLVIPGTYLDVDSYWKAFIWGTLKKAGFNLSKKIYFYMPPDQNCIVYEQED